MTMTETPAPADPDEATRDALADRIVSATTGALELFSIQLGRELGLYELLATEPRTSGELAHVAGIAPRYAREWLEQQAVAGLLAIDRPSDSAADRTYVLPPGHRPVLVDADDAFHVAPMAGLVSGIGGVLGRLPAAYRHGDGIPYAAYGAAFREGQGGINRPAFAELESWLATMPDLTRRLQEDPIARIADVGCGEGWSTLALARAFPAASIDGYDADEASVVTARHAAGRAGLGDRVTFHAADAASATGPYDLILIFEALHDLAQPGPVLTRLRDALAEDGVVLVVDERVADQFTAPGDPVERLMYGWSVLHCLPASLAEQPSAGLGTVLRSSVVRELAADAGYASCTELPIQNDFFRFYRLDR